MSLATAAPLPAPVSSLTLVSQAERAIGAGDDKTAEALISRIPSGSLDAMQLARIQIVRAEIGMQRRQPETVLRSLPPSSAHIPLLSPRMEELRGRAQFMAGDVVAAVRTLVARERNLTSAGSIAENRERIWNGLVSTPFAPSALDNITREDAMTRGWLDLARTLQLGPTPAAIAAWTQRNPGHPGNTKTALVRASDQRSVPEVPLGAPSVAGAPAAAPTSLNGGYALLVPVSGSLAAAGRAVRDGFVAAWFAMPGSRPPLHVYDTGSESTQAPIAYQNALRDGAGFIIGPLTKEGVAAISSSVASGSVPWLTLNYLDGPAGSAMQFGLAPEDEARAAATDAIASGRRNALTLAPSNPWGERALNAFSTSFIEQGGTVLQSARYTQGTQDFGRPLRELLKLDRSAQRHQALTTVLGVPSEFEPRPRQDADLLFAPLRAVEARALVPQLDFFRADQLAAYTVSAAHSGAVDRQLDGMRLCDMPWVLDRSGGLAPDRERLRDLFPEAMRDQPRLFALGLDAHKLASSMRRGGMASGVEIEGATGMLSMAPGNRVTRNLQCRPIRDGRPSSGS